MFVWRLETNELCFCDSALFSGYNSLSPLLLFSGAFILPWPDCLHPLPSNHSAYTTATSTHQEREETGESGCMVRRTLCCEVHICSSLVTLHWFLLSQLVIGHSVAPPTPGDKTPPLSLLLMPWFVLLDVNLSPHQS